MKEIVAEKEQQNYCPRRSTAVVVCQLDEALVNSNIWLKNKDTKIFFEGTIMSLNNNYVIGLVEFVVTIMATPLLLIASFFAKLFGALLEYVVRRDRQLPLARAGKIAIVITGASAGLGKALAFEFARAYPNARLCFGLIGTSEERLNQTRTELVESYKNVKQEDVQMGVIDVRDAAAMRDFIHSFEEKFNGVNVLLANAGVTEFTLKQNNPDLTLADMNRQVSDINFNGVLNTVLPLVERLDESKIERYRDGEQPLHICIVSSLVSQAPMISVYGLTKRAVVEYARYLRKYFSSYLNVHVSVALPGWIDTGMAKVFPGSKPFMISSEQAAHNIRIGMERDDAMIVFPVFAYWASRIVEVLPAGLFEPIFNLMPKPKT